MPYRFPIGVHGLAILLVALGLPAGVIVEAQDAAVAIPAAQARPAERKDAEQDAQDDAVDGESADATADTDATDDAAEEDSGEANPMGFKQLERKLKTTLRKLTRLAEWDESTETRLLEKALELGRVALKESPPVDRWGNPTDPRVSAVFGDADWKKAYCEIVPEEQRKQLNERLRAHLKEQRKGIVAFMMAALDSQLLLSDAQRESVERLVTDCAERNSASTAQLMNALIERKHELEGVLSKGQLATLQPQKVDPHNPWRQGASIPAVLGKEKMGFIRGVSDPAGAPKADKGSKRGRRPQILAPRAAAPILKLKAAPVVEAKPAKPEPKEDQAKADKSKVDKSKVDKSTVAEAKSDEKEEKSESAPAVEEKPGAESTTQPAKEEPEKETEKPKDPKKQDPRIGLRLQKKEDLR